MDDDNKYYFDILEHDQMGTTKHSTIQESTGSDIPISVIEAAKSFLEAIEERDEANEKEDYDAAFEIECDQRYHGATLAEWILEQQESIS